MLEGLSVVRLLGCFKASRTTVKPYRYKAVWYAGRGVDDNSRLEALTIHPSVSRFLLSSNAPGIWHAARSTPVLQLCAYCLAWDSLRATHRGRGFHLSDSSPLSPSAVRSHRAIKREEPDHVEPVGFFQSEKRSLSVYVSRIGSNDTAAKLI